MEKPTRRNYFSDRERDVLSFPIHFARPSADEREVIYIGGGCHTLLFSLPPSFASASSAPGILPVLQDVPVNHCEISSDSSGTPASMPLAAGNLRERREWEVKKKSRVFFENFCSFSRAWVFTLLSDSECGQEAVFHLATQGSDTFSSRHTSHLICLKG